MIFLEYDFEVVHVLEKNHIIAHYLFQDTTIIKPTKVDITFNNSYIQTSITQFLTINNDWYFVYKMNLTMKQTLEGFIGMCYSNFICKILSYTYKNQCLYKCNIDNVAQLCDC